MDETPALKQYHHDQAEAYRLYSLGCEDADRRHAQEIAFLEDTLEQKLEIISERYLAMTRHPSGGEHHGSAE